MKKSKMKTKRSGFIIRLAVVGIIGFALIRAVQVQAQIDEKQKQIDQLNKEIAVAQVYNEDLQEQNENYESYLEKLLREDGFVFPNDQIYQFSN